MFSQFICEMINARHFILIHFFFLYLYFHMEIILTPLTLADELQSWKPGSMSDTKRNRLDNNDVIQ